MMLRREASSSGPVEYPLLAGRSSRDLENQLEPGFPRFLGVEVDAHPVPVREGIALADKRPNRTLRRGTTGTDTLEVHCAGKLQDEMGSPRPLSDARHRNHQQVAAGKDVVEPFQLVGEAVLPAAAQPARRLPAG